MRVHLDISLKLSDIADIAQAILNAEDANIEYITTDTRTAEAGDLFIALEGKNRSGSEFLPRAKALGCYTLSKSSESDIYAPDTENALLAIAALYRSRLPSLRHTIAITGSCGKTTTKDFLKSVLSRFYECTATLNNLNNYIGASFTVFSCTKQTQILILEIGMNHSGEIEPIARALKPDIAIITNIGTAHIGNLQSRERIAEAKLEILSGGSSILITPQNEPLLNIPGAIRVTTVYDTKKPLPEYEQNLVGYLYAIRDLLRLNKTDFEKAIQALYRERKSKITAIGGFLILDDSYNSSPDAVIENLKWLCKKGERFSAVLGDMLELGDHAPQLHRKIGAFAAHSGCLNLFLVGDYSDFIKEGALKEGMKAERIHINKSISDLSPTIDAIKKCYSGEILYIKASHSINLGRINELIAKEDH